SDSLSSQVFSLPHDLALLWAHSHPTLGISLENLSIRWRERGPPLMHALHRRMPGRSNPRAWACPSPISPLRLRLCQSAGRGEDRQRNDYLYKVGFSSHRLFSSKTSNSSRSATTS